MFCDFLILLPGVRAQKHVLRPENLEGTDEEDPITALEWDPLSVEYLLVSNTHNGVRLLDSESLTVIMEFKLPSAAAQVHSLAWINSAPGMFITGGMYSGKTVHVYHRG
jgi:WD40 repeat protein